MPYKTNGTLTTDEREIAISETWDTQAEWEAFQSQNGIVIQNGTLTLKEGYTRNGLQHEWTVSETSGTTVTDSVGTNDWSLNGASLTSDASYYEGSYADFDGVDDSASLDTMSFVSVNDSFSIVVGMTASDVSNARNIFNQELAPDDRVTMGARDGYISAGIYDGSAWVNDGGYSVTAPTGRVLLTLTWDGSSGDVFLDTSSSPDANENPASFGGGTGVVVGDYLAGGNNWDGAIDLMLIYNRRLSSSEVSGIYDTWV